MSFKDFIKELDGNRVEGELMKSIAYSLISSVAIFFIYYFASLSNVPDFSSKYGFYIFFAIASYALIVPTITQVRAYNQFSCMSGMMIGMTSGMMAGFLAGYLLGATNGMFVGGVFGMAVGISLGIWMGSCCGVMGFMEGIMAGFMGGLMGAMTAVMLINDHVKAMTAIIFVISAVILFALNYMIYFETRETERHRKENHFVAIMLSAILTLITTWLIVFGPRGGIFS